MTFLTKEELDAGFKEFAKIEQRVQEKMKDQFYIPVEERSLDRRKNLDNNQVEIEVERSEPQ